MACIGLPNIITHLHRNPGIEHATHPEMFDACLARKDQIGAHLAIEGLRLVYDLHLGVISVVVMSEREIAGYCKQNEIPMFRPVYTPRSEDYWSSVLIVLLRLRYEAAMTNPESSWIDEEDLLADFEAFIAPQDRENSAKTREKMMKKLEALHKSQFVARRSGIKTTQYAATKWLVLRLTNEIIEEMMMRMTNYIAIATGQDCDEDSDEGAANQDNEYGPDVDLFTLASPTGA